MNISLSPGIDDIGAEANRLCLLIERHSEDLALGNLGNRFRLEDASFRLLARNRNTIYRVASCFQWFLKLPRSGDARVTTRERLGTNIVHDVLGSNPIYGGPSVVRVATDPSYVLAAAIPGASLSRVLGTQSWLPGAKATLRLENTFGALGMLLATLHAHARLPQNAPEATKRPFAMLRKRLDQVVSPDPVSEVIARWYGADRRTDPSDMFVHGAMRLDNILRVGSRVGFVDFEHCGAGSMYQDLARPMIQLLLLRAVIAFPRYRATRCLNAYLREYRKVHSYKPETLDVYVGVRLARHYLETCNGGVLSDHVGGLPVLQSRLGRMTIGVLCDGVASVVPNLSV